MERKKKKKEYSNLCISLYKMDLVISDRHSVDNESQLQDGGRF